MYESKQAVQVDPTEPPRCIMAKWFSSLLRSENGAFPFQFGEWRMRQRRRQDRVFVIPAPGRALSAASHYNDPEAKKVINGIVESRERLVAQRQQGKVAKRSMLLDSSPDVNLLIYHEVIDSEVSHKLDISAISPLARTSKLIRSESLTEFFARGSFQLPIVSLIFDKDRHDSVQHRFATGSSDLKASAEMSREDGTSPILIRDITFHIYPFRTDVLKDSTPKMDLPTSSWATWRLRWLADKRSFLETYEVHPEHAPTNSSRLYKWYAAMMLHQWTPQLARDIAQAHADKPDFCGWSMQELQYIAWAYQQQEHKRLSNVIAPHKWGWEQFSGGNDESAAAAVATDDDNEDDDEVDDSASEAGQPEDGVYLQYYTESEDAWDPGYESGDEGDGEGGEEEEDGEGVRDSEADHDHSEQEPWESVNLNQLSRDYDLVSEETRRLIMQQIMHPEWYLWDAGNDTHPLDALFDEMIRDDINAAGSVDPLSYTDDVMPFGPR